MKWAANHKWDNAEKEAYYKEQYRRSQNPEDLQLWETYRDAAHDEWVENCWNAAADESTY